MNKALNKLIKSKKLKSIIIVLFLIYLLVLLKLILFKYPIRMTIEVIRSHENIPLTHKIMNSNLIPLKTIFYYLKGNQGILVVRDNILGNIIAFLPLGFLLPIIFKRLSRLKAIVFSSLREASLRTMAIATTYLSSGKAVARRTKGSPSNPG